MMTKEKALQVKPLLENEAFGKELMATDSPEDILRLFHDRGVMVDAEDLEEIADAMAQAQPVSTDELSESDLENVAGGCDPFTALVLITGVVIIVSTLVLAYYLRKLGKKVAQVRRR